MCKREKKATIIYTSCSFLIASSRAASFSAKAAIAVFSNARFGSTSRYIRPYTWRVHFNVWWLVDLLFCHSYKPLCAWCSVRINTLLPPWLGPTCRGTWQPVTLSQWSLAGSPPACSIGRSSSEHGPLCYPCHSWPMFWWSWARLPETV